MVLTITHPQDADGWMHGTALDGQYVWSLRTTDTPPNALYDTTPYYTLNKEDNMENLQVFQNAEFGELQMLMIDGKPYFPATACAKVLGYTNPWKAVKDHCRKDDLTKREVIDKLGRTQHMKYITEGNLYRLITHSKLPAAERFERWIFDEVLPSIRQTGGYGDLTNIIMQTATAVCSELVKQLTPLLQSVIQQSQADETMTLEPLPAIQRRRKKTSVINKLAPELRYQVDEMLISGRYTYAEVIDWLKQQGIQLSTASVCRYAKSNHFYD